MKKIGNKTKLLIVLITIIILAGIGVIFTIGFNFDLRYQESKTIQLYLGKTFEIEDIKKITDEILKNQPVIIQKVEVYEDSVSILAKDITEEQKNNIINKVNETYQTELKAEETQITNIPHTRGRDIIKPYIMPFVIATIVILLYMAIRYAKLGSIKIVSQTILALLVAEAVLVSILAITRISIGRLTIPMVLIVYLLTLLVITTNLEKKREINKQEDEKNN